MEYLVRIVVSIVSITISALELLIMARAIVSWFPIDEDGPILHFLYLTTEPFLAPLRALLERISSLRDLPMDLAPFLAVMILMIVKTLLPTIHF